MFRDFLQYSGTFCHHAKQYLPADVAKLTNDYIEEAKVYVLDMNKQKDSVVFNV